MPKTADPAELASTIGAQLEAERKLQSLTLRALAARAGVSASLLCSIEKGRVHPSVATLFSLANALGVHPRSFFGDDAPERPIAAGAGGGGAGGPVVTRALTRETRPTLHLTDGIRWQLLTPAPDRAIEFIEVQYPPGASSGAELYTHAGREFALVLEGEATVHLGFERHVLHAGDSIAYDSTTPHRVENSGTAPLRAIWVNHKTG